MPIDLYPPEQRAPRKVDCRNEEYRVQDDRDERNLMHVISYSWLASTVVVAIGFLIYVPVAWVLHLFG